MTDRPQFVASLLSASGSGYAAAAAHKLLEEHPETAKRFGSGAFASWKAHLTQRLEELSAALLAEEPELFTSEVAWSATAFRAREVPDGDLHASLECLRDVLAEELPPESAELPQRYLKAALAALEEPAPEQEGQPTPESTEVQRLGLSYLEAALSGDRRGAVDAILSATEAGLKIGAAIEALMFAQRQVGEMWHTRQLGVVQEHAVTETTRTALTLLARSADVKESNGKTVLVALAPGDTHDMGSRVVATFFELEGWRTVHLADPTPAEDLVLGLEAFDIDLLAISMSLPTQLAATRALVEKIRAAHPDLKVLVGGRSLARSPKLCERIGADACGATAAEAVRLGGRLVGLDMPADEPADG